MNFNGDVFPNLDQEKAIEYNNGPLLLVAGAGTGKTYVITEKIKYLIKKKLAKPEDILGLTFTEKAAAEMEQRIDQVLPYGYFQMQISTFHSFADQILREEITTIGLPANYRLLTQAETIIFLRNNLFLFDLKYFRPLGNPHKFVEGLLQHFSRLKDEDISPQQYLIWAKKQQRNPKYSKDERSKLIELANVYADFQKIKIKEAHFDFSDLIYYLLQLFRSRSSILRKYQIKYKYIFVDEFQDTNIAQYQLIKLLYPPKKNPKLTVVGDDSQAIYKFRGASVSNILAFMKDYPQAKQISLLKNYRSPQSVLDKAYQLIKHNDPDTLESKLGISKRLIAAKAISPTHNYQSSIDFVLTETVEEEADYVACEINKLKKNYRYSDFTILVRANNHSEPFIRTLGRYGIPFQFLGPGMLFKQPEIKDLIAYLIFISDLEDSVSLYRVLSSDIFKLDKTDLSLILSFAKKINRSLFQALEIYLAFYFPEFFKKEFEIYENCLPLLKEETKKNLYRFASMVQHHINLIRKDTAGQILYSFLEDTGLLSRLVSYKTTKEEKRVLNISKFFEKLKTYETQHVDASVFSVVDYLKISMELGESPTTAEIDYLTYDAVNILTVHSAKGLEFPVVFLVNLSNGRFPTYERKEAIPIAQELIKETLPVGDYHQEEERRLFYVGLTRAIDRVYLSAANFYVDGKRQRKISPFVWESLGEEFVKKQITVKQYEKKQLSIFDFKKRPEKIIRRLRQLTNFSFSQLETFLTCPLQYKYQYLLKIPIVPSSAASFGQSIHESLQQFYQEFIKRKKTDLKLLLSIYDRLWLPVGYTSRAHEQRMKEQGKKMLINYYNHLHRHDLAILDLEKFFKIKIDNNTFISGKIDRVDKKDRHGVEIIDYKTGKQPDQKTLKKSLQLSIYALAATEKGLYHKKIDQVTLTFYYLLEGNKISLKRTSADINKVKKEVRELIKQIRMSDFPAHVGRWCNFCLYRMICDAWKV